MPISLPKPPTRPPTGPPKAKKTTLAAFSPESESEPEDDSAFTKLSKKPAKKLTSAKPLSAPPARKPTSTVNAELSSYSSISTKMSNSAATAAEEVDPTIFDYDGAWEASKAVEQQKKRLDEIEAAERKPKYMAALLQSAEVRKRDALRAKEKQLQREREEEGDEFKDKEAFVTEGYKRQMEEMRRLEEEEGKKEEEEKRRGGGMAGFHRNMLNRMERKHEEVVKAAEGGVDMPKVEVEEEEAERLEERRRRELEEKGMRVEVNEEGQVVDKTTLLEGGLNMIPTTASKKIPVAIADPRKDRPQGSGMWTGGKSQREIAEERRARQTRMLEEQIAAGQKREREEEEEKRKELERQVKSRKTEAEVGSAKERYLARKRAAEEAKRRGEQP